MIKIKLRLPIDFDTDTIIKESSKLLRLPEDKLQNPKILRYSLDVTDKDNLAKIVEVGFSFNADFETKLLKRKYVFEVENIEFIIPKKTLKNRPIVVGSGPAGLFSALILAQAQANPIVIERGKSVDERVIDTEIFGKKGILNEESNIQFGEGGAGTFSDGKLKTGKLDKYKQKVLTEFVNFGAPDEILLMPNSHLGTDNLRKIVKNIRKEIINLGGDVLFSIKLTDLIIDDDKIKGVIVQDANGKRKILSDKVILATGHSARDVFTMLKSNNIHLEQKGFGVGVRIEHPQEYINKLIYGEKYYNKLPTASYKFVSHLKNGRNVYTFCNCPGGSVVAATSEKNAVVTNGMSNYKRDGNNANSAVLVSIHPDDFKSDDVLSGIDFQRNLEQKAFNISGDYKAPAHRLEDFLNNRVSSRFGDVNPTYPVGTVFANAKDYMPDFLRESLIKGICDFDDYRKGFYYPDATLTGIETRSTSPVKIIRDENFQSVTIKGLYPCGEGAGYSGGIISSATDGVKIAEHILISEQ